MYASKEIEEMGSQGQNTFDTSSTGLVHEKRGDYRKIAGFEESLAEGTAIGHAHVDLLFKPRRQTFKCFESCRARKSKNIIIKKDSQKEPVSEIKA